MSKSAPHVVVAYVYSSAGFKGRVIGPYPTFAAAREAVRDFIRQPAESGSFFQYGIVPLFAPSEQVVEPT